MNTNADFTIAFWRLQLEFWDVLVCIKTLTSNSIHGQDKKFLRSSTCMKYSPYLLLRGKVGTNKEANLKRYFKINPNLCQSFQFNFFSSFKNDKMHFKHFICVFQSDSLCIQKRKLITLGFKIRYYCHHHLYAFIICKIMNDIKSL